MADIPLPEQGERIAMEDGRPSVTWYRILASMFRAFNRAQAELGNETTGLATKAAKTQACSAHFLFAFFDDGTQRPIINSAFAWSIATITVRTSAGTVTVTPKINGVAMSGGSIAASTTEASEASTGNVAVGDDIELEMASTSADCAGLSVTLAGTITLA